jgi:mono/diheme cytochrome c family protein
MMFDVTWNLVNQASKSFAPYARANGMRLILTLLAFVLVSIGPTRGQGQARSTPNEEDVQKGHTLAIGICAICHVAAPDQPNQPLLRPPAPSFASIVRQKTFDAESLTRFMKTTHRGLDNPQGMPNPDLMDYQIKQIVAYFLSLYK